MLAITPSVQSFVSNGSSRTFQIWQNASLSSSMLLSRRLWATWLQSTCRLRTRLRASLITDPDAFEVGRFIGSYGFMNVTSYSGVQSGLGTSPEDIEKLKVQDVAEGGVKIRLYEGRLTRGPQRGISVILKVYPGQRAAGIEADMMATNELSTHAFLQSCSKDICQNLLILIGGFETSTGEQWLAFRRDGIYTAADYARIASKKWTNFLSSGQKVIWNSFEQEQMLKRRRYFVIRLLQGVMKGLAFMHDHDRLHQSLGPASVVLNTIAEREGVYLVPRLRDLAFSVDVRLSSVEETPAGTLARGLWRRAASAGACDPFEKRAFAIADDIYEAGLLFAYLAFVPFCEAGTMDSLSLQRLIENTFQLDLGATREMSSRGSGCAERERK